MRGARREREAGRGGKEEGGRNGGEETSEARNGGVVREWSMRIKHNRRRRMENTARLDTSIRIDRPHKVY
jgi:hypothetical protein